MQLQDVSFSEEVLVPDYLRTDPAFGGGVSRKYDYEGDDESKAVFDGWVARRWDPAVRGRFIKLIEAIGRDVDGRILPGLPWTDRGYLKAVFAHAERVGVGVGGPDLHPHRRGQQNHSHPLIAARGPGTKAGVAIQDGNLAERNPATGKPVTVEELYRFAQDRLRLDYIFWGTEEPYYSKAVLPFIRGLGMN